jgi:hypothetical protein
VKRYLKPKYVVLWVVIIVFCFVPVAEMEYLIVVEKQVLEPYTVKEEVQTFLPESRAVLDEGWKTVLVPTAVIKEVTKTRLVTRPFAETRTKRVSILRYLLR